MKKIFFIFLIAAATFSVQSCHKEESKTPAITIGDFHEGGIIFYIDNTGEHGLVCTVVDQGFDVTWGCPSLIKFGADGLIIGTGAQNTIDILAACTETPIAASTCNQLVLNGYDDWFLPSKDELDSLYQHRTIVNETAVENEGGLLHGGEYWSSSHHSDNTVWIQSFDAGNQTGDTKNTKHYVRAIREF